MIARVLGLALCACAAASLSTAQEKPPAEEKKAQERKLSLSEQAIEDARSLLLKSRFGMKSPEDLLRVDLALYNLEAVAKDVLVLDFDKDAAFDSGLLRFKITSVQQRFDGYTVAFTVTNASQRPAAVSDVVARLRESGLYCDTRWKDKFGGGDVTMVGKGGLPGNGEATFGRHFRGKPDPKAKFITLELGSAEQFVRVIVPVDKIRK